LHADPAQVAAAIRIGGLANIKASRIQQILTQILEDWGELSLDTLRKLSVDKAYEYLEGLPGVGPKTAACVLLFALRMPALPVDTHVLRVSRRLGLVLPRVGAEKAQKLLESLLPPELYYPFHLNFIQHGRTLCKARRPQCQACPLLIRCNDGQGFVSSRSEP